MERGDSLAGVAPFVSPLKDFPARELICYRLRSLAGTTGKKGGALPRVACLLLVSLALGAACPALHAQEVSWQEAVARLAQERTRAETCAALLRKFGDALAVDRGAVAYNEAKAEYDGIVAGLGVALARKAQPESLADLQERLKRGFDERVAFCKRVEPLMPPSKGEKGPPIADIVTGVVKPLTDAVVAI